MSYRVHNQDRVDQYFRAIKKRCIPVGRLPERGSVVHVVYQHDHWCRTMATGRGGDCTCSPEVARYREQAVNGGTVLAATATVMAP